MVVFHTSNTVQAREAHIMLQPVPHRNQSCGFASEASSGFTWLRSFSCVSSNRLSRKRQRKIPQGIPKNTPVEVDSSYLGSNEKWKQLVIFLFFFEGGKLEELSSLHQPEISTVKIVQTLLLWDMWGRYISEKRNKSLPASKNPNLCILMNSSGSGILSK